MPCPHQNSRKRHVLVAKRVSTLLAAFAAFLSTRGGQSGQPHSSALKLILHMHVMQPEAQVVCCSQHPHLLQPLKHSCSFQPTRPRPLAGFTFAGSSCQPLSSEGH
jgi:hypothetical protein